MKDFNFLKKLNNFFLHNIRTQIAIIVSGTELIDLDDEFKDSIKFSAFLLDAYDALFSVLMDAMDGKYRNADENVNIKEEVEKLVAVFNGFSSNNTKFRLVEDSEFRAKISSHVFRNLMVVLMAESINEEEGRIEVKVFDSGVRFYCKKDIPAILLEINKLMENYGLTVYKKNGFLEVLVK